MASPVFYFTFILYLFGEGVAPTKNAGSTLGTVQEKKSFSPLTPAWAFDRGFCLGNFIYPLTPAGCPPLPGRRCCSAAFSPGESKKRLPPLREPESGGALKRRNAAAYPAKAEKLSSHAGCRPTVVFLGRFYPLTPAGCPPFPGRRCCSAAFSPGESKKRLPPLREPESGGALKKRNAAYSARAEKLFPRSRRRGRSTVVFAWAILFTRSRRRAVRRSPVAGAAPPHFRPAR